MYQLGHIGSFYNISRNPKSFFLYLNSYSESLQNMLSFFSTKIPGNSMKVFKYSLDQLSNTQQFRMLRIVDMHGSVRKCITCLMEHIPKTLSENIFRDDGELQKFIIMIKRCRKSNYLLAGAGRTSETLICQRLGTQAS